MTDNFTEFLPEFLLKTWQHDSEFHLEEWTCKVGKILKKWGGTSEYTNKAVLIKTKEVTLE